MSASDVGRAVRGIAPEADDRTPAAPGGTDTPSDWPNTRAPDARLHPATAAPPSRRGGVFRALLRNPNVAFGLLVLLALSAAALAAPVLYPDDPLGMVATPLLWPGQDPAFPLGSDSLGRDVLAGLLWGSRVSILVGLAATALSVGIGVLVGAIAGYAGGWLDDVLVHVVEIFQTLPSFVLLVVLVAIAQPTVWTITAGIAIVSWPTVARLTRAEFRSLREKDFVMAARSLGYGHARIVFREILPNALPPLIVAASLMVASAILMEASLSFMGLGDPNVVSWGSMIGAGRELIRTAWYLTVLPGLAIVLTVMSVSLVADGLNDVLNPRLSEER